MTTRFMTTLVMVTSLLASGQALAQRSAIPNFQRGQVLTADQLNRVVERVNMNANALSEGNGDTHAVDCSSGTIASAMSQAQPGDTIMITGACNETVVVDKDGITLDGQGSAVIDGGGAEVAVINVTGHQNVVIKGLTVQNGQRGILLQNGAAVSLEDVTAQNNRVVNYEGGRGIFISSSSTASFTGTIRSDNNQAEGIVIENSNVVVTNATLLQMNGNGSSGIGMYFAGHLFLEFVDEVKVNGNGRHGIFLSHNSTLITFNVDDPMAVQVNNNGRNGITVGRSSSLGISGATFTVGGNGANGLEIYGVSYAELSGSFTYLGKRTTPESIGVFSNNGGTGVKVIQNSHARFYGGTTMNGNEGNGLELSTGATVATFNLTIKDNDGYGIHAWSGCGVELIDNATIMGNSDGDVEVLFGSRLSFDDNVIIGGAISCDDTVVKDNGVECS